MYKSQNFTIDEHGLNVIENFTIKEHIDYIQIDSYEIKKSNILKNRFLIFILGTTVTITFTILLINIFSDYSLKLDNTIAARGLILLWVALISLIVFGASLIINVFVKRMTLHLNGKTIKTKRIDLGDFQKRNQIKEIDDFIKERVDYYNKFVKNQSNSEST